MKLCHVQRPRLAYPGISPDLSQLIVRIPNNPIVAGAAQYEDMDVGEEEPVRCLKSGLWLLEGDGVRLALLLQEPPPHMAALGIPFQILAASDEAGTQATRKIFKHLEEVVRQSPSYRGKILSLEGTRRTMTVWAVASRSTSCAP